MTDEIKPMGRIKKGWIVTKSAWQVLKMDKELVMLPILSAVVSVITIVGFVATALAGAYLLVNSSISDTITISSRGGDILHLLAIFVIFLLTTFVVNFFGAAITYGAIERFRGNDPTVRSSVAAARRRIAPIAAFSLLTTTIGFALQTLEERVPLAGKIAVWLLNASWSIASMFAVPVIVMSDKTTGPFEATKKSVEIIKKTWGETAVSQIGIGIIQLFAILGWFALYVAVGATAFAIGGTTSMAIFIGTTVVMVVCLLIISIVFSTLSSIAKAAIFYYATTGESPEMFNKQLLREAMTPKKAKKIFG
ncbi:hypothetical protein KC968_02690 [Candidatus Saccharibacteria bacterium]|nr:hypothetical protein [Candidatus Saccharibacteria bacterium]